MQCVMSTCKPAKAKYLIHDSDKIILENHPSTESFPPRGILSSLLSWGLSRGMWADYTRKNQEKIQVHSESHENYHG